jgi:hypothetical protein
MFVQKDVASIRVSDGEIKFSRIPEEQLSQTPCRRGIKSDSGLLSRLTGSLEFERDTSPGKSLPCVVKSVDKKRNDHGLIFDATHSIFSAGG